MPATATANSTSTTAPSAKRKNTGFSSQAMFSTSKLIQNLGSNREQYKFTGGLRSAWGRD